MLEAHNISKVYGEGARAFRAIDDVSFSVEESEFVCIVGPSGCGKTTLLKCVSGLLSPTTGDVHLRGKRVTAPPPEMGLVLQDYSRSLMPWMTVEANVAMPLRAKKTPKAEIGQLVSEAIGAVGLSAATQKYPWELSGGMQQRVAIARALAYHPEVLVMDEPFASVDAQTRSDLEDLVLRVRHDFGVSVLLVTHDIDESVYLSDRVVVLSKSPTTNRETIAVDLPRPRDQIVTKSLPEFARLRTEVHGLIRTPSVSV